VRVGVVQHRLEGGETQVRRRAPGGGGEADRGEGREADRGEGREKQDRVLLQDGLRDIGSQTVIEELGRGGDARHELVLHVEFLFVLHLHIFLGP
jgi:hypothetical protein